MVADISQIDRDNGFHTDDEEGGWTVYHTQTYLRNIKKKKKLKERKRREREMRERIQNLPQLNKQDDA